MTYVITEDCQKCKYTDCVEVCPAEAFHEAETILYINPEACTDCDACVDECPVNAIYADVDLPGKWQHWIDINAIEAPKYPVIYNRKLPLVKRQETVECE